MAENNPQTAQEIQEKIWRKEAELDGLVKQQRQDRKGSRVMRISLAVLGMFAFFVMALNGASFLGVLGGIGVVSAIFIVGASFLPNKKTEAAISGVEGELYVLRNRWAQRINETGF